MPTATTSDMAHAKIAGSNPLRPTKIRPEIGVLGPNRKRTEITKAVEG
jgi:hypothetical protein